jgi:hypothetical protein
MITLEFIRKGKRTQGKVKSRSRDGSVYFIIPDGEDKAIVVPWEHICEEYRERVRAYFEKGEQG